MTMRADHKALVFLGAVGVLGAGVRVVRASTAAASTSSQEARAPLERQMQSADSSAKAAHAPRGRGRVAVMKAAADTAKPPKPGSGPLDRRGYIGKKLDLDVATAMQIDSLPGVSPTMAKRIVADRMARGPFLNLDGLRRVPGAGPSFVRQLDSLVTFSGTVVQPNAGDTIIVKAKPVRVRKR